MIVSIGFALFCGLTKSALAVSGSRLAASRANGVMIFIIGSLIIRSDLFDELSVRHAHVCRWDCL